MPRLRGAERALSLLGSSQKQQYICRACRVQVIRQFHSSQRVAAGDPWMQRIKNTLFGSKESKDAEEKREKARQTRVKELTEQDAGKPGVEVKSGGNGKEYEVAAFVDPAINKDYVRATTWDKLESVGSEEWVRARADQGERYIGFLPQERVQLADDQWQKLLHHIAVELLTVREAGRDLSQICLPRGSNSDSWLRTRNSTIVVDQESGDASLLYETLQDREEILHSIPEAAAEDLKPSAENLSFEMMGAVAEGGLEQYPEDVPGFTSRPSWMHLPLSDPNIKLTILKRTMQLTGHRIPDPTLSASTTLADLYNAFKTKEKPKKLAQTEQLQRLKAEMPNVAVHATRRTPIHKEKEIGRWKVIEDALRARDLPITGSRWRGAKSTVE